MTSYSAVTKILTIELTTPNSFEDITIPVPAQKMILRHYRCDLDISGKTSFLRGLNLEIGSVVGTNYVLDDDAGFNYLKIGLSRDQVWTHPANGGDVEYECQSTVRDCYLPLTMAGDLPKNFSIRVRDDAHNLIPAAEFKYLLLQFELTGGF
ncbi:hypothetical protein BASA81_002647 [Batrachochytrium salamandrivorans]|nr:hypothetical protein BASA81_002647 [Batrachochytrium salamandrivorans]